MFALNIDTDGRILSATLEKYAAPGNVFVDALPNGNINDYLFMDGVFVHDPLPATEEPKEDNLQERVAELEEALLLLLSGVTE